MTPFVVQASQFWVGSLLGLVDRQEILEPLVDFTVLNAVSEPDTQAHQSGRRGQL